MLVKDNVYCMYVLSEKFIPKGRTSSNLWNLNFKLCPKINWPLLFIRSKGPVWQINPTCINYSVDESGILCVVLRIIPSYDRLPIYNFKNLYHWAFPTPSHIFLQDATLESYKIRTLLFYVIKKYFISKACVSCDPLENISKLAFGDKSLVVTCTYMLRWTLYI